MTKPWRLFLLGLVGLLALPALAAIDAKVTDMSGDRVVLEFDAEPAFAVGDTVELTYQAGFMDMLMGSYAIRDRQGNRLVLSTISTSNLPSQGMRVRVNRAIPIQFAPPPASSSVPSPSPSSAPAIQAPGEGRVVHVSGNAAEVEFPAGIAVQAGDRYTLAYEAPRVGRVNIAGTWRVKRITGQRAQLEAEGAAGQARVGQVVLPQAYATTMAAPAPAEAGGLFPNPPPMSFEEYLRQTQPAPSAVPPIPPAPGPVPAPVIAQSWVGLQMQGLTPDLARSLGLPADMAGILVADVVPGSPAERAGLQNGDVILDVDGRSMPPHQLADRVRQFTPDTLLRLRILRDGVKMFVVVRTAAKP
ncbi:MAG: protease Do [bacterium]|nr:MAG: protease Do [bacterium]KAF0150393.1 MAG: protease Do [bacterium]KAF0168950.1 MAG: protease Do [bacterium]